MNTIRLSEWLPSFLVPFFTLSYPTSSPPEPDSFRNAVYYETGRLDACLLVSCIVVMAVLRDLSRLRLLEPFARWRLTPSRQNASGLKIDDSANRKMNGREAVNGDSVHMPAMSNKAPKKEDRTIRRSVIRFAEQGWSAIYYTSLWLFGLYIHCNLPTAPFNPEKLWIGYPHVVLAGPIKLYYVVQTAFYLHQILILNAEVHRKDHVQMMLHHIITIALLLTSYFYNFTRVGCLILLLMDFCDIFLPLAKMLRYLAFPTLCDITFTFFLLSWFVTRHVLFIHVIYSAYADAPRLIPFDWIPERGYWLTKPVYTVFVGLLVSLQAIQILWFWLICRIAWRVVSGQGAEDARSDDEDEEDGPNLEDIDDTNGLPIPPYSDLKKNR